MGGPPQTLAWKVGHPGAISGQAAAVRVGSRAGEEGNGSDGRKKDDAVP